MKKTRTVSFVLDDVYCDFLVSYGKHRGETVSTCIREIVTEFAKTHGGYGQKQLKAG